MIVMKNKFKDKSQLVDMIEKFESYRKNYYSRVEGDVGKFIYSIATEKELYGMFTYDFDNSKEIYELMKYIVTLDKLNDNKIKKIKRLDKNNGTIFNITENLYRLYNRCWYDKRLQEVIFRIYQTILCNIYDRVLMSKMDTTQEYMPFITIRAYRIKGEWNV